MRCEEFAAHLESWLDGELPAAQAAAVETHLAACSACRAAVAERQRLRTALRELVAAEPPADLRAAILAGAAATAAPVPRRRWSPLAATSLAAAALLLVAFGLKQLAGERRGGAQHGLMVLAYVDGAFEAPGAIRTGELKLAAGPGALPASARPTVEGESHATH